MALKGTESKQKITKELLEYFGDRAFLYNDGKEIRVNCIEAGEVCQIKITLTAAKVAVENGSDNALPGTAATVGVVADKVDTFNTPTQSAGSPIPPTAEEKKTISELLSRLGL